MEIIQVSSFKRDVKKLHLNQKQDLDKAIREISKTPTIGTLKTGDLTQVRIYKFKMVKQLTLLAYYFTESPPSVLLLAFGSHENFYRDLKKKVQDKYYEYCE